MGGKAVETTPNINNTLSAGTANEHTVPWWLKKFCKGDESFEDEECSGWPWEVDYNQLRAIIESDPLTSMQEVAKELSVDHSTVIGHLKQIEKVKKLDKWVPHELTANQKNLHFDVSSFLILCDNNKHLIGLRHLTISGFSITDDNYFSGCTKKTLQTISQSQTCTQKSSW